MQTELEIIDRDGTLGKRALERIRKKAEGLEKFYPRITSCRVVADPPDSHQGKGQRHNIRVEIGVPGNEIIVKRQSQEDMSSAIRDAFDAARRQLEEYGGKQRDKAPPRPSQAHARIAKIMGEKDYGFLETEDGDEVYFHRNSLSNGTFEKLEVGTEVQFTEEQGDNGPQAITVKLIK